MIILQPAWLLLVIPLGWLLLRKGVPKGFHHWLHSLVILSLILALAGISISRDIPAGTLVLLVDRSDSMPAQSDSLAVETADALIKAKPPHANLAVVGFGASSILETEPGQHSFEGFRGLPGSHASHLAGALERADTLIPSSAQGRVLVFSDGMWTGQPPDSVAERLSARSIPIDFQHVARSFGQDTAIVDVKAPQQVPPNEGFLITISVVSAGPEDAAYRLTRNGIPLTQGVRSLKQGHQQMVFRAVAPTQGSHLYEVSLEPSEADPQPENNRAQFLVTAAATKPILHVSSAPSSLAILLQQSGLDIVNPAIETISWELSDLANYSAIILENLPARAIGKTNLSRIVDWVQINGNGLLLTGGAASFSNGGYFGSPLEDILPVSMELREEHRKLKLAVVVTLDRSGSMGADAGGRTKMNLANQAVVNMVELLSPMDEFGLFAVDVKAHQVLPLRPVKNPNNLRGRILGIQSGGGGIYVETALKHASRELLNAKAGTRHILLFADAADAEKPGDYKALLERFKRAGITLSVIALGTPKDRDGALLTEIANLGEGRIFFTNDARELPQIFSQETFLIAKSSYIEGPVPSRFSADWAGLSPKIYQPAPTLSGYNLTYLKPKAAVGLVSEDEYNAPLVAYWQAGAGRVLCFTADAARSNANPLATWPHLGAFFQGLVRWTAGQDGVTPNGTLVTQTIDKGAVHVTIHLDPEREEEPFKVPPRLSMLRGRAGEESRVMNQVFIRSQPDRWTAVTPLSNGEVVLPTLTWDGTDRASLAPVRLPYQPEFAPASPDQGYRNLGDLAAIGGGRARTNFAEIWDLLPRETRFYSLRTWLLAFALTGFLLAVYWRRIGFGWHGSSESAESLSSNTRKPSRRTSRQSSPKVRQSNRQAPADSDPPADKAAAPASELNTALALARRRAAQRTGANDRRTDDDS